MYIKSSKSVNSFAPKVTKVSFIALVILVFVLTILVGIHQNLNCFIMKTNIETSKNADLITKDPNEVNLTEEMNIIHLKAPVGYGKYICLFNNSEVWVVDEMSVSESIGMTYLYSLLDITTYMFSLWVVYHYLNKHRGATIMFIIYEFIYLFGSSIVYEYSNKTLYNISSVGFILFFVRVLVMITVIVKAKNFNTCRAKNVEKSK